LFSEVFVARVSDAPAQDGAAAMSGEVVALKATHLSSMVAPHNSEREVRILRKAVGENVVPLLESFYDGAGHLVLVSPFLPLSLEAVMHEDKRAGGRISNAVKNGLRDLFAALAHIHALGIIHRDVKPSNILLSSPAGPAYLSDFGIAWMPGDAGSENAEEKITDVGTTCYRAPEVLFGYRGYDSSFDNWAAGCVVAEAATGKELWESGDAGTELTLVLSILKGLGTPGKGNWPVSGVGFWSYSGRLLM
jgi:cyclin-dependent kinase